MAPLSFNISSSGKNRQKKVRVEMDAEKFERLAASFGLFSKDFVNSLNRAERDYKAGRTRQISSLRSLRKR